MVRLQLKSDRENRIIELPKGRPVFAGRAPECDIVIPSPAVSRRHAVFIYKNGICAVKDLNSFNGTYLNSQRIAKAEQLRQGDVVTISSVTLTVQRDTVAIPAVPEEKTPAAEEKPPQAAAGRTKPPSNSAVYANSSIPLPRSMSGDPSADALLDDVPPNPDRDRCTIDDTQHEIVTPAKDTLHLRSPAYTAAVKNAAGLNPAFMTAGGTMDTSEFTMAEDDGTPPPAGDETAAEDAAAEQAAAAVQEPPRLGDQPETGPGVTAMPIPEGLWQQVDARITFYSELDDLAEERNFLRMQSNFSMEAEAELIRQESELDSMPDPEEADALIAAMLQRHEEADAKNSPPTVSGQQLRRAEELGLTQWHLIRDSGRSALPAVTAVAYRSMEDEPLALALQSAGIDARDFLGAAAYYLALEKLAGAADTERNKVAARTAELNAKSGGLKSLFGKIAGSLGGGGRNSDETERLAEKSRSLEKRLVSIGREMNCIRNILVRGFWSVYTETALYFLQEAEPLHPAVRAFLRYGALSLKPWWLHRQAAEYIAADCRDNIKPGFSAVLKDTHVLYADEYLAAVALMECCPIPDEKITGMDKNEPEWKAERAFRRVVNASAYTSLLRQTLDELTGRTREIDSSLEKQAEAISDIKSRPFASKDALPDMENEYETNAIRRANLAKHAERLAREILPHIQENASESEARLRNGELRLYTPEELLRRECHALADAAARTAGKRPLFMPLVLREHFRPGNAGMINDRPAMLKDIAEVERRDPGIFQHNLVPSKKRANRIDMRMSPIIILLPSAGIRGCCLTPQEGMEPGHLALPLCFSRGDLRQRQLLGMLADFRWETSKKLAGKDVMNSKTLAGEFMKLRWEWRNQPKDKREKILIYNELGDMANWRRIYEMYIPDSLEGGRRLAARSPECYKALIGTYIDLPEGVNPLK